jgi:AcrR family transcriptional regulator
VRPYTYGVANYTSAVVSTDTSRRRDARRTRQRLIDVAGRHFAEHGYDGTSVRAIAAEAGVAANLITRYFGGKAGLFAAATTFDLQVQAALTGPLETLGDRIARGVVDRWESASTADPLLMMIRSAGTSPSAAQALATFFATQASGPLADHLTATLGCTARDAADRASAAGAFILGVVTSRYIMRNGPAARADRASLTAWLGDRLQRLLDDPPPPPLAPPLDSQPCSPLP